MTALPPSGDPARPIVVRRGANLPHWTRDWAIYSITFRLADSVPAHVAEAWWRERDAIIGRARATGRPIADHETQRLLWLHREKIEQILDNAAGSCSLATPAIARTVQNALLHFDAQRYDLLAWCVMPNHVHTVFRPLPPHELPAILHSWKSFTSHETNKMLARRGEFWQPEYYDHLVRDQQDLERCIRYVLDNPAKAGLANWPWLGFKPGWDTSHVARPSGL